MKAILRYRIFMGLCIVAILLGCFASALSLFTSYQILQYTLLGGTYLAGLLLVHAHQVHRQKKNS